MEFTLFDAQNMDLTGFENLTPDEILKLSGEKMAELVEKNKHLFKVVKEKDMNSNEFTQDEKDAMLMCKQMNEKKKKKRHRKTK